MQAQGPIHDQGWLRDEQQHPGGENPSVQPKKEWKARCTQVARDRVRETKNGYSSKNQRHDEVERLTEGKPR